MFQVVVLLVGIAGALGQSVQSGACFAASKAVVQSFDISQFVGQWHQIERIADADIGDCVSSTFASTSSDSMTVVHRRLDNGVVLTSNGTLTRTSNVTEARWNVTYLPATETYPFLVLATDYTGYALIYSCADVTNNTYQEWAWKLSRTTSLTADQVTAINSTIQLYPTLAGAFWRSTNHTTEACRVNGSHAPSASGLLILVAMIVGLKQVTLG